MHFDFEEYLTDNLERAKLTTTNEITATCPFCERYGSFYVNAETGRYICFKCNNRGRRFADLIAHIEDISREEAIRLLVRKSVKFRRKETPGALSEKIRALRGGKEPNQQTCTVDFDLPDEFIPVYKKGKWNYPSYLKQRGVKKETARDWGLGFCSKGRYANRIIIPARCPSGKSFEARAIWDWMQPKTLGPMGADKSRLLMGWPLAHFTADLVLVEGPFDALKAWQFGANVMALMGKNLSPAQFALLCQRPAESSVIVMLDPEEVTAQRDAAAQLYCYFDDVYIATLPKGVDPGAATSAQFWDAYHGAKEYKGEMGIVLSSKRDSLKSGFLKFG